MVKQYYRFTETELEAYYLYAKIVMISGWVNVRAFQEYLKQPKYRDACIRLLKMMLDDDLAC